VILLASITTGYWCSNSSAANKYIKREKVNDYYFNLLQTYVQTRETKEERNKETKKERMRERERESDRERERKKKVNLN
jgi:hypothetical protein